MRNPFKTATGAIVLIESFGVWCWATFGQSTLPVWLVTFVFIGSIVLGIFSLVWLVHGINES